MIVKSKFRYFFTLSLIVLFLLTLSSEINAQKQSSYDLKSFKITIENTKNGLKLLSSQGSAWKELSFSVPKEQPRLIDEFGMVQLDNVSSNSDFKLADYLFTITKTVDGIKLTGLEGTAWKGLSFSLRTNEKIAIDQLGMTDL